MYIQNNLSISTEISLPKVFLLFSDNLKQLSGQCFIYVFSFKHRASVPWFKMVLVWTIIYPFWFLSNSSPYCVWFIESTVSTIKSGRWFVVFYVHKSQIRIWRLNKPTLIFYLLTQLLNFNGFDVRLEYIDRKRFYIFVYCECDKNNCITCVWSIMYV